MSRISDLMVRRGEVEGQRALNRGAAVSNTISSLAGIVPAYRRGKQEDEDRATQQRLTDSRLKTDELQQRNLQGDIEARDNAQMDEAGARDLARSAAAVNQWLTELASMPEGEEKKAAYLRGRQALVSGGHLTEQDAPSMFPGQSWVKSRLTLLLPAQERFKQLFPDEKAPEPFTLSPGQQRFGPDGKPIASVAATPPADAGFTLSPGQQRYGADGRLLANGPAAREPQGPQPTEYKLVGPNGEQKIVRGADAANALLGQGWKQYDAAGERTATERSTGAQNQGRRAQDALSVIDSLVTFDEHGNVKSKHPGFDSAFGSVQAHIPTFRQDTADAKAIVNRIVSLVTQPEMQTLRGLGPASDRDVAIIQQGATTLSNPSISEAAAAQELKRVRDAFARLSAAGASGGGPQVPAPGAIVVQTPDGQSFTFANQQQADQFKRSAGIP